jgi:DNA repair protein RecO
LIAHTSAIILKSVDYSESSKIVTLFSREHGKIAAIVKGAKKPKSKFAGLLEVGNLLDVVYYYKGNRSVQTLTEATYLHKTLNLRLEFEKMATAMSALELITQLLHDNEVNHPLFDFTKEFLIWLNDTDIEPARVFPYLQIRLADLMGFGLQLEPAEDHKNPGKQYINLDSGLVSAQSVSSHSYKLSKNQYHYIVLTLQSRNSAVFSITFENGELKDLVNQLDRYLKFHVEGLRSRKSDAIFEQILQA